MRNWRHETGRRVALAGVALALAAVAACAPGASNSKPDAKSTGAISTDVAKAGKVTLTEWDINTSGGADTATTQLNKEFEQKYPNVTIKRVARTLNDLKATLKLALSSKNPPDVVQANQGYPDMGAFVKANLLLPLDNYAKVYGWNSTFPKQLLALNKFSSDGKKWQTGNLYGVSQTGEIVGIYYNKKLLKQVGLPLPKTFSEFEADLPKIKAKGQLPIQFGTGDKSPAIHLFGVAQAAIAGKQEVRDMVASSGSAKWTDASTVQSAQVVSDWAKKGYLTAGANGLTGDEASANFGKGQGVFRIDGTWRLAELDQAMGSNVGFMSPPPMKAGQPSATEGGEGLAWSITSKTKHADVAGAYLNFITDAHAEDVLAKTGNLPAVQPPSYTPKAGSLNADIFAAWKTISQEDGLTPYLDYTTPTFYDTITSNLQQLIGGKLDPKAFTKALQADAGAFKQSN